MLLNGSEKDKLFAKLVPVSLKDAYTNHSRTSQLFLTMEWQEASAGMYNKKVLVISLTDNEDPFFLYNLHLSEEDFQMLKTSQDLLIDFASLHQHIIEFIEKALVEQKNPQPKFLLVFSSNEKLGSVAGPSQFDIVETNQFKHLIHLSLKFVAATESAVKQYLISCFRHLKDEKRQLEKHLTYLEQDLKGKLATSQHNLNSKEQELELLRKEQAVQLTMKDSKHTMELQEERDRLIMRHKEEESRIEQERKKQEHKFRNEIQQLNTRVAVLDDLNKALQDQNYEHESTIKKLKSKVISLEDETRRLKENVQSYKHKYDNLHSEIKEKQSNIRQQDERINELQQELCRKEQAIARLKKQIEAEDELKKSIETELDDMKFRYERHEKTRKLLESDKEKLNDVIVNLQEKLQEVTKEEKAKNHLALKFKKISEEKEKALVDRRKDIAELNICLEIKSAEIQKLTDSNNTLQKKLEDLEKDLRTRESAIKEGIFVIKWLNRQLTDNCIVPQYTPSNQVPSPSSIAQKQLDKISSSSPQTSPTVVTTKNTAPKSVRIDTASPVSRKSSSTPSRFLNAKTPDSAYYTSPSGYTNEVTPEILHGNDNVNFDQTNYEIDDPEAVSAAFRNGNHILKHSTAKKQTNSVKSVTPKNTPKNIKKR